MHIEKWYADFVVDGEVSILYRANLALGPFRLGYQFSRTGFSSTRSKIEFGGTRLPAMINSRVRWPAEEMAPALEWHGARPRPTVLWRSGNRLLTWNPMVLNGQVEGQKMGASARGYVECLTMNFRPWELGLKTLRWGRFCGSRHSLVWIDWEGRIENRLALLDGIAVPMTTATRTTIRADGAQLAISEQQEIVSESMNSGALKSLGLLRNWAPRQFLSGIETKWLAKGVLTSGASQDAGFVIHEEVVWK